MRTLEFLALLGVLLPNAYGALIHRDQDCLTHFLLFCVLYKITTVQRATTGD